MWVFGNLTKPCKLFLQKNQAELARGFFPLLWKHSLATTENVLHHYRIYILWFYFIYYDITLNYGLNVMTIKGNQFKLKLLVFGAVNTTINDQGLKYSTEKPFIL